LGSVKKQVRSLSAEYQHNPQSGSLSDGRYGRFMAESNGGLHVPVSGLTHGFVLASPEGQAPNPLTPGRCIA
jgi:hypothetical protein